MSDDHAWSDWYRIAEPRSERYGPVYYRTCWRCKVQQHLPLGGLDDPPTRDDAGHPDHDEICAVSQ